MSKKGRKKGQERSRHTGAGAGRNTPPPAAVDGDGGQVTAMTVAAPIEPPPVIDAPVRPSSRPRIETPIAFEAPPTHDDTSIPPVDLDSHFFASDPHHLHHDVGDEHEERDPRMRLKLAPATAKRRAQLQKYVKVAVGAASALCLAALVKVAVAHNHEAPLERRASASMQVTPPPAVAPVAAPQVPQVPQALQVAEIPPPPPPAGPEVAPAATVATAAAAVEPAPTGTTEPAATAAPAAAVVPESAASAPAETSAPTAADPKAAAKEKHASQLALERGKAGDAVEAGERSVALDPSDAEAWLILGAAYQAKGDAANARRSFKACLEQGKRGPRWECAQMPH